MPTPVVLNFNHARRSMPPKHFADYTKPERIEILKELGPVSYTHLTLPTTPYV